VVRLTEWLGGVNLVVNCGSVTFFLTHKLLGRKKLNIPTTIIFHCEPFCCLQTSQLGNMDRNASVEHPASTSRWSAPRGSLPLRPQNIVNELTSFLKRPEERKPESAFSPSRRVIQFLRSVGWLESVDWSYLTILGLCCVLSPVI
jgi:hypothetical protein